MTLRLESPRNRVLLLSCLAVSILLGMWLMPCGCFGLTFWAPAELTLRQIYSGCEVLRTNLVWVDANGNRFDPSWSDTRWSDIDQYPYSKQTFASVPHFEIRELRGELFIGLGFPDSFLRARNHFRVTRGALIVAADSEWDAAQVMPWVKPQPFQSAPGRAGAHMFGIASQLSSGSAGYTAFFSYDGPPLEHNVLTVDGITPWIIKRKAFIEFYHPSFSAGSSVLGAPMEFFVCGNERWMRHAAAWHGDNVFTMPLRRDGRALLVCQLKKNEGQNTN